MMPYGRMNPDTLVRLLHKAQIRNEYTPVDDFLVALDGYRPFLQEFDIHAGRRLCDLMKWAITVFEFYPCHKLRQEFMDQVAKDVNLFLSAEPSGARSEDENRVVGDIRRIAYQLMPERFRSME